MRLPGGACRRRLPLAPGRTRGLEHRGGSGCAAGQAGRRVISGCPPLRMSVAASSGHSNRSSTHTRGNRIWMERVVRTTRNRPPDAASGLRADSSVRLRRSAPGNRPLPTPARPSRRIGNPECDCPAPTRLPVPFSAYGAGATGRPPCRGTGRTSSSRRRRPHPAPIPPGKGWSNPDAPMNGPARFRPSSRAMTGGRNVEQRPRPCRGRREPEMAASAPIRSRKRAAPFGWPAKGAAIDHDGRRRPGGRQR